MTPGEGWVWGLDCGSSRAALGFVDPFAMRWAVHSWGWRDPASRGAVVLGRSLMSCHLHTVAEASQLASRFPPATVAAERPSGGQQNPSLMMHAGALLAATAVATALHPWTFKGAPEWKPIVGLPGNCGKGQIAIRAAQLGMQPEDLADIDKPDALLIAAAAAKLMFGVDPEDLRPVEGSP